MEQPYLWFYFFVFGILGRCLVITLLEGHLPLHFFLIKNEAKNQGLQIVLKKLRNVSVIHPNSQTLLTKSFIKAFDS